MSSPPLVLRWWWFPDLKSGRERNSRAIGWSEEGKTSCQLGNAPVLSLSHIFPRIKSAPDYWWRGCCYAKKMGFPPLPILSSGWRGKNRLIRNRNRPGKACIRPRGWEISQLFSKEMGKFDAWLKILACARKERKIRGGKRDFLRFPRKERENWRE